MDLMNVSKYLGIIAYTFLALFYLIKLLQEGKKINTENSGQKFLRVFKLLLILSLFVLSIIVVLKNNWALVDALVISVVVVIILLIELYYFMAHMIVKYDTENHYKIFNFIFIHKYIPRILHVLFLSLLITYFTIKMCFPGMFGHEYRDIIVESDYGNDIDYKGELLGVLHSRNPNAQVYFLSSNIREFDAEDASWSLWRSSRYFPKGTIFLALTNPGGDNDQGGQLAIETKNGLFFVAVDKGILDYVVHYYGYKRGVLISNEKYKFSASTPSEGIDGTNNILGPVAADISAGMDLSQIGRNLENYIPKLKEKIGSTTLQDAIIGRVMSVDNYGNINLNITSKNLADIGSERGFLIAIHNSDTIFNIPIRESYSDVIKGFTVAILNGENLQLAINYGNFSSEYRINVKDTILILKQK